MAWAIGANDVANAMASTVGSKILSIRQAVLLAAVCEALGAMFASGEVTNMIRFGIVDLMWFENQPLVFVIGMLAALLSASTWLIFATSYGLPVSTTHTIVGAVLGFGLASVGPWHIEWSNLGEIVLSWLLSPAVAIIMAFTVYRYIETRVFNAQDALTAATRFIPKCAALVGMFFTNITLVVGLPPLGVRIQSNILYAVVVVVGVVLYGVSFWQARRHIHASKAKQQSQEEVIENMFNSLAIGSAATMAFAHGANDVANAIGPVAAIITVLQHNSVHQAGAIPFWLLQMGAGGVVLGLITYGYRIMETVGSKITQLTPSRGFAAQFSTSVIIISASALGMPVSTTQIMVGSILGIGLARGLMALNMSTIKSIFISWSITIPTGIVLAIGYFLLLKSMWGI